MFSKKEMHPITLHKRYSKLVLAFSVLSTVFTLHAHAQNDSTRNIETRYLRPTVVNMFSNKCKDEKAASLGNEVISKFKNTDVVKKFDQFKVKQPVVIVPEIKNTTDDIAAEDFVNIDPARLVKRRSLRTKLMSSVKMAKKAAKLMKKNNRAMDDATDGQFKTALKPAAKEAVAQWFDMDENGDCSAATLIQRGKNTILDKDKIIDDNSMVRRAANMGKQLIDRTYFFVYNIDSIQTQEETYEEQGIDETERTQAGYNAHVTVAVYKLNFGPKEYGEFNEKYYTDKENHDRKKADAWKDANYDVSYVTRTSFTQSSLGTRKDNVDMGALLNLLPELMQNKAVEFVTKLDRNLAVKTDVYSTEPLTAKIGVKEDLYTDKRFFIYMKELDVESNAMKAVRMGVARVKPYYSWDTGEATGNTEPSKFQQQGGKKVFPGFYLEEKDDLGLSVYLNGGLLNAPQRVFGFGAGISVSKYVAKLFRFKKPGFARKIPGGIQLSIVGSLFPIPRAKGDDFINMSTADKRYSTKYRWTRYRISDDFYFGKRGLLFVTPGIGLTKVKFDGASGKLYLTLGGTLSYNVHPYASVYAGADLLFAQKYDFGYYGADATDKVAPSINFGVRVNL